jgi:hypothetical protein
VDVKITASNADEKDLWSLQDSLARDPQLRGRSRLLGGTPQPGTMGAVAEALTVALEPGGAMAAFSAMVITWLRMRTSSVHFRVTREDGGSIELLADRVRDLDTRAVRQQVTDLARFLSEGPSEGSGEGSGKGEALEQ